MSHWAEIDENNTVLRVVVGNNNHPDEGYSWIINNLGGRWVQTSYNKTIRKNYAGVGFTYDEQRDAFIAPQPFPSWVLDEEICQWQAPKPKPDDGKDYEWNEDVQNWTEITGE